MNKAINPMKRIIILSTLFLITGLCKADYTTTKLPELLKSADLIIECRVTKVLTETVDVEISEVLKGDISLKQITVERFKNWTCASRWASYKIGQTELMFLVKSSKSGKWYIIGSGNEGEMPVIDGLLYYKYPYLSIGNSPKEYQLGFSTIHGFRFKLNDVKIAIKEYLNNVATIDRLISDNLAKKYKTDNPFLVMIIKEQNVLKNR